MYCQELAATGLNSTPLGSPVLQGIGEPTVFLASSVFFAIKDAVAAARSESGLVGPFSLDSPAIPERVCLACISPFTQMVNCGYTSFFFDSVISTFKFFIQPQENKRMLMYIHVFSADSR